jgi:hypothetical protein
MFKLLIDTCVWLDLAKDAQQRPLLGALEQLVHRGEVSLIVPAIVREEFARNKGRVAAESGRSISGALKRAREIVDHLGGGAGKRAALRTIEDVAHRLPSLGEAAIDSIGRIERLLAAGERIQATADVKVRAADRALTARAPFHRQRNSMADAIIIESYAAIVGRPEPRGTRFSFVTHNTKDFSHTAANEKLPHPDIASFFSRIRSLYCIRLAEVLRRVDVDVVSEAMLESETVGEPRRLSEILAALDELFDKVWYDRHQSHRARIERGQSKIVERETFPVKDHRTRPIQRDVWEGALRAAARVEKKYGRENLGPWSDFEWGMINGKLSALRWAIGDEWDNLDT